MHHALSSVIIRDKKLAQVKKKVRKQTKYEQALAQAAMAKNQINTG